jgi:hypothetical protein
MSVMEWKLTQLRFCNKPTGSEDNDHCRCTLWLPVKLDSLLVIAIKELDVVLEI